MNQIKRLGRFLAADHRYVYLGTSVIAAIGLAFSQQAPTPLSLLARTGLAQDALWLVLWAWLAVSAAALVTKLIHRRDYAAASPLAKTPSVRRAARTWCGPWRRSSPSTAASWALRRSCR